MINNSESEIVQKIFSRIREECTKNVINEEADFEIFVCPSHKAILYIKVFGELTSWYIIDHGNYKIIEHQVVKNQNIKYAEMLKVNAEKNIPNKLDSTIIFVKDKNYTPEFMLLNPITSLDAIKRICKENAIEYNEL